MLVDDYDRVQTHVDDLTTATDKFEAIGPPELDHWLQQLASAGNAVGILYYNLKVIDENRQRYRRDGRSIARAPCAISTMRPTQ